MAQYERCRLATVMGKSDCLAAHSPVRDGRRYHHPAPPARRVWEHRGGSGSHRLGRQSAGDIQPGYPIFNWDDLPVKEGLHNRHMVGLTAWHTFFQTTHLTLHEKKVLVIGYGLVGQGVAAAAKALAVR